MLFLLRIRILNFAASADTLLGNLLFLAAGFFLCWNRKKAQLPPWFFWAVAALWLVCEVVVDLTVAAILPERGGFYLLCSYVGAYALMFSIGALAGFLVSLLNRKPNAASPSDSDE